MGDASRWAATARSERELRARGAAEAPMSHNARNWAELPESLMAKVVRTLPFESLVSLRRVSREWRAVVVHHAGACRPNPAVREVLMVADGTEYACYSPEQDEWYRGSVRFQGRRISEDMKSHLRASAGGLLLFVVGDALIVSNPLTRTWRELPKFPGKWAIGEAAMGMCYHAPSHSYQIVVAESGKWAEFGEALMGKCYHAPSHSHQIVVAESGGKPDEVTAVYSSLTGEWDVTPGLPEGKTFPVRFTELVYIDGSFFGIVESFMPPFPRETFLARYRVQQQRWSVDEVVLPCDYPPDMGKMDGQILLAAPNHETKIAAVSLLALSPAQHRWNVVKLKGMSRIIPVIYYKIFFVGGFMYCDHDHPSLLVHNCERHSWNSASELPNDIGHSNRKYCAFEPCLLASP